MNYGDLDLATLAIRSGYTQTPEMENSEAIFPTSSFAYESAEQAAARFSGEELGNVYSRFTNPTVRTFEHRLAALEGAESCVATSSGMSAILALCMGMLEAGDHIVASRSIFGTTFVMFENILKKFGLTTSFVDLTDLSDWESAIQENTKLFFMETPANPMTEVGDIRAISELAHKHGIEVAVDNCFCTPILQRPLELGADYVVHSATKYLDGQGRCLGGAVLGKKETVGEKVYGFLRTAGVSMSPFNAWVFLKGLETLEIRMKAHCENAMAMANWLVAQPNVKTVHYPGLESHPQHELAKTQQSGFGGIVSFEIEGGREEAFKLINSTELLSITANLGDTKTIITHPASTTHSRVPAERRDAIGVTEGLIRLSVGLESVKDIQNDLAKGL